VFAERRAGWGAAGVTGAGCGAQLRLFKEEERLEDSGVKEKALAAEPSMAAARKELDAATARAVEVAEQLMVLKKDAAPAAGWGSAECRLGGTWNKIFTTGRDASFRHKRRGNAVRTPASRVLSCCCSRR